MKEELCENVMKVGSMNASVICLFGSLSEGGAVSEGDESRNMNASVICLFGSFSEGGAV